MTFKIRELESGIAWRTHWKPAMFRNARFHVEVGSRESGRRIVPHEFPKRDIPYAEDMGRKAREFAVRGYIIVYPHDEDGDELHRRDYTPARDRLIVALETEGPADLQLPFLGRLNVACTRYRVTEERKLGGYCVFDMTFVEYGQAPAEGSRQSASAVVSSAANLNQVTIAAVQSRLENAYTTRTLGITV